MRTRWLLVALCAVLPFAAACGGGSAKPDGGTGTFQCSDGIDNDGDGKIDFPDDDGCTSAEDNSEDSATQPQCNDGRDNDGDGKIDFPNDPGCFSPIQNDETDDCPDGPMCPQCGDGKDNDGNGLKDYPDDPGCTSAADTTEFQENVAACGGMTIKNLPAGGSVDDTFDATASSSDIVTDCGGGQHAPAIAYEIHLTDPKVIVATTDASPDSTIDTIIDIRGMMCSDPTAEIACNDNTDATNPDVLTSTATASLQPGTYYVIVEGYDASITGAFHLDVKLFAGEGATCSTIDDCGTGLVCRIPMGDTVKKCTKPMCSDGLDDDGDGKADYPDEPGCDSPADDDETDTCNLATGAGCPACSDKVDNDTDGTTDYPADPSCSSAAGTSESCTSVDPILSITAPTTHASTAAASDDFTTCALESGGTNQVFAITVPALQTLTATAAPTDDFFGSVSLIGASCGGAALACDDSFDMTFTQTNLAAGTYFIVFDDDSGDESGEFDLTVHGEVAPGGSCEGALFTSGVLTCSDGLQCKGPTGSKTCSSQCSDGIDNNGDGKFDFPNDPGCDSAADDTETTVCPGPSCPACSNGIDDDNDGNIDYPADPSCTSASGTSESCASADGTTPITGPSLTDTLVGATNDYELTCDFETGGADRTYEIDVPALTSLHATAEPTDSSDIATIALFGASCNGAELPSTGGSSGATAGCQKFDADLVTGPLAAGPYFIVVDNDFADSPFPYTLTVSGIAAPGAACTSPLFAAHVLSCTAGQTCTSGTCQ